MTVYGLPSAPPIAPLTPAQHSIAARICLRARSLNGRLAKLQAEAWYTWNARTEDLDAVRRWLFEMGARSGWPLDEGERPIRRQRRPVWHEFVDLAA